MTDTSSDVNVPTLRHEIISEVISITKNPIIDLFQNLYKKTKTQNKSRRFVLNEFQLAVRNIKDWTVEDIKENTKGLDFTRLNVLAERLENMGCDVISWDQILFDTYLTIARELWRKPYLLYDGVSITIYQESATLFEKVVTNGLKTQLRRVTESVMIQENITKAMVNSSPKQDFESMPNNDNQEPKEVETEHVHIPEIIDKDDILINDVESRRTSDQWNINVADAQQYQLHSTNSHHSSSPESDSESHDDEHTQDGDVKSIKSMKSVKSAKSLQSQSSKHSINIVSSSHSDYEYESDKEDTDHKEAPISRTNSTSKIDILDIIPRTSKATSDDKPVIKKQTKDLYKKYYNPQKTINLLKKKPVI